MKILVTCPPMLKQIDRFHDHFASYGFEVAAPNVVQTLPEVELVELMPQYDGWIIGDDPATAGVFEAGAAGKLKAAVKWGIGVDNVDFAAAKRLGLKIINTPGVFGAEVADLALHYLIGLARHTFEIDREIRKGGWPKPTGQSLAGKTVAVVGFGDIGSSFAKRVRALNLKVIIYDPSFSKIEVAPYTLRKWPEGLEYCDFVVLTCALTPSSQKMINRETLKLMKTGTHLINVARGGLIDESALIEGLQTGRLWGVALDVFETEPLPKDSPLRSLSRCVFGSHNGSNTTEAVERASLQAIKKLAEFLKVVPGYE